jgi:glycosyltransferase involved in cell wall biosynthesis
MNHMIEDYDIVCFSGDWDGDPLSKRHIMLRLARRNRVLWVNSIGNRRPTASTRDLKRVWKKVREFFRGCRQVSENFHVYSPLVIPFHGNRLARALNRRFMAWHLRRTCRQLGFRNVISWSFIPSSADLAGALKERLVIYHCVDEFSEFTGTDKRAIRALERQLMVRADAVIVSSAPLLEAKRAHNPNTFLVTHGVEVEHFRRACDPATVVPDEIASLPKPVIGFYGLIADWVDLALVQRLARARPTWSFVLIGKSDTDMSGLQDLGNVHWFGRREYAELPGYARGFDVAILPFVVNDLTLAANPLKLREYLAAGLPVVATDIPEARRLEGHVRVAGNDEEFLPEIERILASGKTGPQAEISQAMDHESWDEKVEEMSQVVERLERSRRARPVVAAMAEPLAP